MSASTIERTCYLADENDTVKLGQLVGSALSAKGGIVFLSGTLGAGKTTFTRGVLNYFGHSGSVKSPTYTLVEPYELAGKDVYHFDLYRLADPEELEFMGIREYFDGKAVCVVEWPDKGQGFLPQPDLLLSFCPQGEGRNVTLQNGTEQGYAMIKTISGALF